MRWWRDSGQSEFAEVSGVNVVGAKSDLRSAVGTAARLGVDDGWAISVDGYGRRTPSKSSLDYCEAVRPRVSPMGA